MKFETFESRAQLETLREEWGQMSTHPNSDIDAFLYNCAHVGEGSSPFVLVCRIEGIVAAILPCRIELGRSTYRVGYKTIGGPLVKQLVITYPGVVGLDNADVALGFVNIIRSKLNAKTFDAVLFYSTPANSSLVRLFSTEVRNKVMLGPCRLSEHWRVPLPIGGVDEFLLNLGAKHRYWMRRLPRVLEKEFPGEISIKIFTTEGAINELAEGCESIAKNTYHRAAGVGFKDSEYWRGKLLILAKKEALRGYILYIKGEPAAFWIGTLYRGTLHLDFTGYLPKYKKFELGTQLFLKLIDDSISAGATCLDYGLGALWYKERFGGESWPEVTFYLFAGTFKGRSSFVLVHATGLTHAFLRFAIGGNEKIQRFMKVWREKLTNSNNMSGKDA